MSFKDIKTTFYYILESPRILAHNIYTSSKGFLTSSKAFSTSSTFPRLRKELQTIAYYKAALIFYHPNYKIEDSTSSLYVGVILEQYRDYVKDLQIMKKHLAKEMFVYDKTIQELLVQRYTDKINLYTDKFVTLLKVQLDQCKKDEEAQLLNNQIAHDERTKHITEIVTKNQMLATQNRMLRVELEELSSKYTALEDGIIQVFTQFAKLTNINETHFFNTPNTNELFKANPAVEKQYKELFSDNTNAITVSTRNLTEQVGDSSSSVEETVTNTPKSVKSEDAIALD